MNVESIPIAEITPYKQNNRKHSELQVERISKSIKDFGFNQPLVLDQDKTVLVGHGRLLAAQRLGIDVLPCLVVKGLTEAKKRAYRILDNKLQNDSEWDFEALELELEFLEEQNFDLTPWGLEDLLIKPNLLDSLDIGTEERESDYQRTFMLTKEQCEQVDKAIKKACDLLPEIEDGNQNGAAITQICVGFLRNA